MNTDKIITGERIQFSCDEFLGFDYDFNFNPRVLKEHKNKCLNINKIDKSYNNKYKIFVYAHRADDRNVFGLIERLNYFENPFILIFHNSDGQITDSSVQKLKKISNLRHIYVQNSYSHDEMVTLLPIGIANRQWPHGNLNIWRDIFATSIKKENKTYINFSNGTNKTERGKCWLELSRKGYNLEAKKVNYMQYLKNLKESKLCICPEGNGIDTHRFWETLYVNTIPVCKKSPWSIYWSERFPIILVDKWSDFNEEKAFSEILKLPSINYSKLDINNIIKEIL